MKKYFILLVILLPIILFADEYTLDKLIEIGLKNSYSIEQAKVSRQNAESSLKSSWIGLLPSATISAGGSKNYENEDESWNSNASFQLNKNISLNEPSYYDINSSILNMKNANLLWEDTQKLIAYTIFCKYLSILEAQQNYEIQKQNLNLQRKINLQIKLQFETGDKSILELKQSQISLIDYEIDLNDAENSINKLRKDLFSYLDIEDEKFELAAPKIDFDENLIKFKNNLSILQMKNDLKSNKISLLQQKMNFLPSITFGYTLNHNDSNAIYDFENYERTGNTISLNASYSIFNLLETRESYLRSKRNFKLSQLNFEKVKKENQASHKNLLSDLKTIKKSKELNRKKLELAKENLEMAQKQYEYGIISLLDFDQHKIEYQNAEISNLKKHYELLRKQEEINLLLSNKILGKW